MVCFRPWQAKIANARGVEALFCPREHAKGPTSQPFRSGATQGTRGLLALPGIEYERSEAPSGARWSVSEISLEIEAAEPPDGGGSRNRHSP